MLGRFRDRVLQFVAPILGVWSGPRVDQVEGIALEDVARDRDRIERLAAVCSRPSAFSDASSSACTPSETRLTPAAR